MIDDLTVAKAATFFRTKKRPSDRAIEGLFTTLRANYGVSTHNIFRHVREPLGNARWSAICFSYKVPPAFLDPTTDIMETLCGYLLLVEYEGHIAMFSSRISLPAPFKTQHFFPVPIARVEGAVATANAVFRKMRMRNMTLSQYAMRNKTLEAPDLSNAMGPGGSRRYAPQAYTVTADGALKSATPGRGRIAVRSDRVGYEELVEYAKSVIDELCVEPVNVSSFIRNFARPISLADALASSQPITFAIDATRLAEAVDGDEAEYRLVRPVGDEIVEVSADDLTQLLNQLDQPLIIQGDSKLREAKINANEDAVATISLNRNRIALRSLDLGMAADIEVESRSVALGSDPERRSLRAFLDDENAFIVLFDDVRLAYIDGQVFRDETLLDGGATFLRYLHPDPSLQAVTSEKGTFAAGQTEFDAASSFGAIVTHIASPDTTLVCDDLGDEWADFIGIREEGGLTRISFYHAKHDNLTLSAGSFHVSISQATKNLGNMALPEERMQAKVRHWGTTYNAPRQPTQIVRTIRAQNNNLADVIARARTAPDIVRRAVIVTSSLSRQAVQDAFDDIRDGQRPTHTFVQLYWLLQLFFSTCADAGVMGAIVCQP
jgi:hypothetical protein